MSSDQQIKKQGKIDGDAAVARQVTDTAREALKQIVGHNLLPWPDIYSAEFWQLAHKSGYDEILLRQHTRIDTTNELAEEFLGKADKILDGVHDTVSSFVSGAREHTEILASSIENIKKMPAEDPDFGRELDTLLSSNIELLSHSSEVEDKLEEQTRIINELQSQLRIDPMTRLLNRGALSKDIKKEIAGARRYRYPLSIFMADIDHFKNVNDVYGHLIGDSIIKITAKLIQDSVRETDSVYRYGGEEFLGLLPHINCDQAEKFAERIREKIAKYLFVDKKNDISISITISAGITELHSRDDETSIVARVDKALYLAKQAGRNKIRRLDFS